MSFILTVSTALELRKVYLDDLLAVESPDSGDRETSGMLCGSVV